VKPYTRRATVEWPRRKEHDGEFGGPRQQLSNAARRAGADALTLSKLAGPDARSYWRVDCQL
jgi:hypothetical protein